MMLPAHSLEKLCHDAVRMVPGWTKESDLLAIAVVASMSPPGDFVEVGSFCGRSSVVLGQIARSRGNKVYCVDLFPNERDFYRETLDKEGQGGWRCEVETRHGKSIGFQTPLFDIPFVEVVLPELQRFGGFLQAFKYYTDLFQLRDTCVPIKATLMEAVAWELPTTDFAFAFIDGDHSFESVYNDIRLCSGICVDGAPILLDDVGGPYTGPTRAASELLGGGVQLTGKVYAARNVRKTSSENN